MESRVIVLYRPPPDHLSYADWKLRTFLVRGYSRLIETTTWLLDRPPLAGPFERFVNNLDASFAVLSRGGNVKFRISSGSQIQRHILRHIPPLLLGIVAHLF